MIYHEKKKKADRIRFRKAKVSDTMGETMLELEGDEENIRKGIQYMKHAGVEVEPLEEEFLEEQ